jgi:nitroimidazol reductase NimA-like FMN-containing flavoprotein (pyridoxamine 5'-phosphate oxidase superfamily)
MLGNDSASIEPDSPTGPQDHSEVAEAPERARNVEELETAQCWQLLEAEEIGRLAIEGQEGRPDVFPVNYLVHDGNVFIRSAPGTKLRSIAKNPAVAFEIDGETTNYHWSVVVHATATRLDVEEEIEASGVRELVSASPTAKENVIRLTPVRITGRRFLKRNRPGSGRAALPKFPAVEGRGSQELRPDPIPSFAPLRED